jgi:hypothetical protein
MLIWSGFFRAAVLSIAVVSASRANAADTNAHPAPHVASTGPNGCPGDPRVTVGGVTGFASLADPSATADLVKSCSVGLYIHAEAWKPLDDATRAHILSVFAKTGPAVVELGYVPTPEGYFKNFYKPTFLDKGVQSDTALINGLCAEGIAQAKRYVDAARGYGLKRVAVVFAPNSGQYKANPFADEKWSCERDAALYGGALAIDAPPHVFLGLKDGYINFIIDEIRWANQNHVATYYIVSPNASGERFADEATEVFQYFKRMNATPSNFVFETYDIHRNDVANHVGKETDPTSVVGVTKRLRPMLPR